MALIGSLTSGVSAMRSFTKGLEVIGNNIANVNTTSFKSSQTSYADSFSNLVGSAGGGSSVLSAQVGTGVRLNGITSRYTQGGLATTGVPTDLGVSGNGFFRVKSTVDSAEFATRAGEFRIDDQGYLVNPQGYRVQGLTGGTAANGSTLSTTAGDIMVNANKIPGDTTSPATLSYSIDRSGNIVEFYDDGTQATTNRVLIQNYSNPGALQKQGDSLFTGLDSAGPIGGLTLSDYNSPGTNGLGKVESGTLELSNVDLTEEFSNLITTQRSFQASSRLITVSDNILEDIVNLKR